MTVKLFNDSGILREETVVQVGSGELFIADAAQLLGLDPNDPAQAPLGLITGYLDIELKIIGPTEEAPLALGTVTFLANQGESQAVLPMIQDGQTSSSFLQVAESDAIRFFTGLAILNAGQEDAQITVRALDVDGVQTAEVQLELEAGDRVVDRLSGASFFGSEFVQVGGHIEVISDVPVITFALFGDLDSRQLSAVEGQSGSQ